MEPRRVTAVLLLAHLYGVVHSNSDARQARGIAGQLNTLIVGPDHFEPHYITSATPAVTRARQKVTSEPPTTTDQPTEEGKTEFATKTIYGFLDFITTVGDTVMVFTPNSKTEDPKRKPSSSAVQRPAASRVPHLSPSAVSPALQLTSAAAGNAVQSTPRPVTAEALFATPSVLSLESSFENSFDGSFGSVSPATNRWSKVRRRRPQTQRRRQPATRVPPTTEPAPAVPARRPPRPQRRHPTLVPILIEGTATPSVQIPPETRVSLRHNVGYRVRQRPSAAPTSALFRLEFQSAAAPAAAPEPVQTPIPGRLVLSSIDVRPTGLVTTFGGTEIAGGRTTVHTTSVIGTYILGRYAQVLQSSSTIFSTTPTQTPIRPSSRQTLQGRPTVSAAETPAAAPQVSPAALESDILPLERLFSALDGDEAAEEAFADLLVAGSRPSREVVAPSRPARFTLRRASPSRLTTPRAAAKEETTTLPPRRSYSSGRTRSRGPTQAQRRKQQLLEKRRRKLTEEPSPTKSPSQPPRQKKAEPLARQQFGSRTSQRPERTSSLRYPGSRNTGPQYSDSLSYPQAAGSVVRPQYADHDSRRQYPDSRGQYHEVQQFEDSPRQRYQTTRQRQPQPQYQDPRQQYQDIRQQYQEPVTRRPVQSSRLRVTHPQLVRPGTTRPRTRITQPTRPPTTRPTRPPPTRAPRPPPTRAPRPPPTRAPRPPPTVAPRPPVDYVAEPYGEDEYYYDYYEEAAPEEEAVTPTAVAEHNDGEETKVLAVSTFKPKGATDFYHEITTLKTMRHITLGRYTNSQWITQTKTRTVPIESTVSPSPSRVTPSSSTLTPSVLLVATTTTPKPQIENLLGSESEAPAVMLPPVHLDPSSPSLPLHTMTETYSTTQLVLKSSVIPLVIADNTRSFTITQTYHVTRVVTALKTMPPVELFDERSGLVSSSEQLKGSPSQNQVDANGVPISRLPASDSLASVGGKFDPDALEKSTHPEMLALHGSHDRTATEAAQPASATAATAEAPPVVSSAPAGNPVIAPAPTATPALPNLGGNQISPLNQLGQLNQLAQLSQLAQLGQTNQLGGLGQMTPQQLLYLQLLSPYLAQLRPAGAAAAPLPAGPRTVVSSSPVLVTTTVTNTNRRAVVVTFRATPSTAYITSTTVVPTVLTSYVTSTMTMAPQQSPLFG